MKKILTTLFIFILYNTHAREGMWLPQLLKDLNEPEMKSMGMLISADDIYSINQSSLKDAVLQFGGGCTGELVSSKGLLITNHHCGFSQIQSLSTLEKNYLDSGFWAKTMDDEIPCPGLTVTFIREIKDVTSSVLFDIPDSLNEEARSNLIKSRADSIEKTVGTKLKGVVRSFYFGNQFFLFVTEVFSDVRFVGAPPQSIGKFGGETDNWIWPRHNADFSLFRVYADKENKPAAYSKDNKPYSPPQFFKICTSGVKEDDFVMVFGFPGRTNEYLLSPGLDLVARQTNPNRIEIRERRLEILRKEMSKNDTIRLQYASRFATLENAYKKWKGEMLGFGRFDVLKRKKEKEDLIFEKIKNNPLLEKDTSLVAKYFSIDSSARNLNFAFDFYAEAIPGLEIVNVSQRFKLLIELSKDKKIKDSLVSFAASRIKKDFIGFYKNFNASVDKQTCAAMLSLSHDRLDKKFLPEAISVAGKKSPDFVEFTKMMFENSLIADSSRFNKFFSSYTRKKVKRLENDPAFKLLIGFNEIQTGLQGDLTRANREMNRLQRIYMHDILETDKSGRVYPDANSTLRVSYGKVKSMIPSDAIKYDYFTTGNGILEKSITGVADYKIPERFSALLKNKDFGKYGKEGEIRSCFIASTHTTGGNSGSPCLNAKGELVGVNFDRVWEGILSDYYYVEDYSRNISVDIRFILFIIDKYGNAGRLIDEMSLVN